MSKISVIIPVYNKAQYLKKTIDSVLNQSMTDFELIIVNDGSTDQSIEIINSFNDKRIKFINQTNQGVAAARNLGVANAGSELIAFLDADDLWFPNHLAEILKLAETFPQATFFGTAYQIKYESIYKDIVYPFKNTRVLLDKYYRHDKGQALFYTSNFAVRKNIFLQEGGFKRQIDAEDTEFFLRLGTQYPMAYSRTVTMMHIKESENSLFSQYQLDKKVQLLDFFARLEQTDPDLKTYLDLHRFAWTMEYLLTGHKKKAQKLKRQIDHKNLNTKQTKNIIKLTAGNIAITKKNPKKTATKRCLYYRLF